MPPKGEKAKAEEQAIKEQLSYYKKRVEDFEKERGELLESIDKCSVQAAEVHRLSWENRRRSDEIRELQKALSDAHAFLFEERQRLLALQAENDELRLQEIEDRKRIQQLLDYDPLVAQRSGAAAPEKSLDTLMLKVESLQAQMHEQQQLSDERVAALLEDRRIRDNEEQAHRASMNQQLEQSSQKLKRTEELLRQATKDAILARRDKQQAEERLLGATAELAQEKQQAHEELMAIKRKMTEDLREIKQQGESKMEDATGNLRRQLKLREDELMNLGSVHTATKAQLEKRVVELEVKSSRLTEQNKALELRRHMDMEGLTADASNLRKMLSSIDKKLHEMRLIERLGEDDRLDKMLAHIRQKAPQVPLPQRDQSDVMMKDKGRQRERSTVDGSEASFSVKSELAHGLKEIKGRIKGLEERIATKKKDYSKV